MKPETFVEGAERLTRIFGRWPTFHDAEIIEFNLWRGDINPAAERYILPVLTTKIHLWDLTPEINSLGHYVTRQHTLATLRFHHLEEFCMDGFNYQNAIYSLTITTGERDKDPTPLRRVRFESAFGLSASFDCARIEVVDATTVEDNL